MTMKLGNINRSWLIEKLIYNKIVDSTLRFELRKSAIFLL